MHILLIIDDMHPRSGGPPVVVAESAAALAAHGHAVTILSVVQPGDTDAVRERWAGILSTSVVLDLINPVSATALFKRVSVSGALAQHIASADVVHLHGVWNPIFIQAARLAQRLDKPYFVSTHGVFDYRAMTRIRRKWLKKRIAFALFGMRSMLENAAAVFFGSESEAKQSWIASPAMTLAYLPNGAAVSLGTVPPTAEQLATMRAVAPATASWTRTILCRSRLHAEKGIDLLVQAFNNVAADFPGTGLLIAGLRQDDAFEAALGDYIARGPAPDRIILTPALTGPDNAFLYQLCDIFAMPSISEGFSMGLVEGLANSCPMLITRFCHVPEVNDVGAGVVVAASVAELERGLRTMLDSDCDLVSMGKAARRLFERQYTWDHVIATLDAAYNAAARRGNPR